MKCIKCNREGLYISEEGNCAIILLTVLSIGEDKYIYSSEDTYYSISVSGKDIAYICYDCLRKIVPNIFNKKVVRLL